MILAAFAFMQPALAIAGLVAIGLPLWIHLYRRVASRRVPVSSLRLVPELPRIARRRKQIQHWPLFLLRALGVLLLGLAFARPGLSDGDRAAEVERLAAVFVLDRTGSMTLRSADGSTAWDATLEQVRDRLSDMHPQSRVRLFCYPPVELGEDWISPSAMRKVVAGLTPSMAGGRPLEALREAAEAFAGFRSDMPESLEIIGDLQRLGWDGIDTLTLPEELRIRVNQVGNPEAPNRGLSLQVRGRDRLRRGAVVTHGGGATLVVHDQVGEAVDTPTQEIPLLGEVQELPYRASTNGWVRREVSFHQASDGLPEDDTLFDTFFVTPEIPVLLLEPEPEAEAFLQTTFFLYQALRPTTGDAGEDSRYLPRVIGVDQAVDVLSEWKDQDAIVVVPALAKWPEALPGALEAFVQQGGGVVFFAGPEIQPPAYAAAWAKLLPARPGEVLAMERRLTLQPIGESHQVWGSLSEGLRRSLRKAPFKKRFALELAANAEVSARYVDDVPLVTARQVGNGKALFVNTSPDRAWGDWPTDGALFVPALHLLMASVVDATPTNLRNSPGAGIVGVPFDVRVDPSWAGIPLQIADRTLDADEQGWVRNLRVDRPGLFDLKAKDGRVARPVAVNFPPQESRREFFSPVILQRQLEARLRAAAVDGDSPRISTASESDWWRWILCALILVCLAESWLALKPMPATLQQGAES